MQKYLADFLKHKKHSLFSLLIISGLYIGSVVKALITATAEMLSGHSIPPAIPSFDGGDTMPTVGWQARLGLAANPEYY